MMPMWILLTLDILKVHIYKVERIEWEGNGLVTYGSLLGTRGGVILKGIVDSRSVSTGNFCKLEVLRQKWSCLS